MELPEEQLKIAETELKRYLPRSQQVYGYVVLRNRVKSDPVRIFVDRWPQFKVIICKPQCEQKGDLFKDTIVFANNESILEEIIGKSSVIDWTSLPHMETLKTVASKKGVQSHKLAVCHMMMLTDVSQLPSIDSSGFLLSSLDESHVDLVNQKWKFGQDQVALRMIQNMIKNFPSCCVLDAEGQPVSWILIYTSCAMGMLYTLPEHRGKGYAKVLICTMAKKLHSDGYPVYCYIEEENKVSYKLFKNMGFTEDPSHREAWFGFNNIEMKSNS